MKMKSMHGRLMLALTIVGMLVNLILPTTAGAVTVSKSFTTHSTAGTPLLVFGGESLTFTVSGTFSGTVYVQRSDNGSDYRNTSVYFSGVNLSSSAVIYATGQLGKPEYYRVYCSTHQSGTIVTALADVNDQVRTFPNLKGVTALEIDDDGIQIPGTLSVVGAESHLAPVMVSTSATSGFSIGFCGAFQSLPTSGYAKGCIVLQGSDNAVYVATATVTNVAHWVKVGAQ